MLTFFFFSGFSIRFFQSFLKFTNMWCIICIRWYICTKSQFLLAMNNGSSDQCECYNSHSNSTVFFLLPFYFSCGSYQVDLKWKTISLILLHWAQTPNWCKYSLTQFHESYIIVRKIIIPFFFIRFVFITKMEFIERNLSYWNENAITLLKRLIYCDEDVSLSRNGTN